MSEVKSNHNIDLSTFYKSSAWERLRREVLEKDKYECQIHKQRGYYVRANTVHHVKHVKEYPELALSKYYRDKDNKLQRNLISLCHDCHERIHDYRRKEKPEPLTPERW